MTAVATLEAPPGPAAAWALYDFDACRADSGAVPRPLRMPAGVPAWLLVGAMAWGVAAQGAFFGHQARVVLALAATALALSLLTAPATVRDLAVPLVTGPVLAGGGVLASALVAGDSSLAYPSLRVLGLVAGAGFVTSRATARDRGVLIGAVIALGAAAGLIGFAGVALHLEPHAQPDQGLWRGASTLTYANATACVAGIAALLSLGRMAAAEHRHATWTTLAAYAALVGLGATLSRAGIAAVVAGTIVLGLLAGARQVLRFWPVLAGAAVALAGLLPSLPEGSGAHPLLAALGLLAGAAISLHGARLGGRRVGALLAIAVVAITVVGPRSARTALGQLGSARATADSVDRSHEWSAALDAAGRHPVAGVGPGRLDLAWTDDTGATVRATYAHNEYLQTLAETGIVGLLAALAGLALVGRALVRSARRERTWLWPAAAAALVAFGVHSGFDFLWHIPALPLLVAVVLGACLPTSPSTPVTTNHKEHSNVA